MSYSSTTLIGNLGQHPETKTFDNGNTKTRLSLATSRSWKNAQGEKQEETQWHNVVLWNKLGQLAQQYLRTGSKVLIVGQLKYRTSEYEGTKRYYTDIVASEMKFLDSKKKEDDFFPSAYTPAPPTPSRSEEYNTIKKAVKQPTAATAEEDKDLPF